MSTASLAAFSLTMILLMSLSGSAVRQTRYWWPPAGEHLFLLGVEPFRKIVPLPVTGRVDRCWDVVPACWREHCFIRSLMVLPPAADVIRHLGGGEAMRLFVGDDWAEEHHDVEVMDAGGRVLAKR